MLIYAWLPQGPGHGFVIDFPWATRVVFCALDWEDELRRVFFLTSSIARQKYHNNLLPLVRVGLNLVGFARGYGIDGRFDRFHSWKVFFPLLISNLCRKDMKHFVIEKPMVQMEDLLQQACHEMRTTPAVCLRSYDWFWFETVDFRHLRAKSIHSRYNAIAVLL